MRTSGLFLSLSLVLAALAAGPGVAAAQSTVTLTVSVHTPAGDPVQGATLVATWGNGSTSETTASNGKAFVDVPEGANVSIGVRHPDYVRNAPHRVTDADERDVSITVYEKASARVAVEDGDGPVDNATVTMTRHGVTVLEEATTDGAVETGTIEAGEYDVRVAKPGYYASERTLQVENDTEATVAIERGTVTLTVNVTDDYFAPPRAIEGATATIGDVGAIKTQSDGEQRISVPVNTRLSVAIAKDGYETVERTLDVGEADVSLSVDVNRTPAIHAALMSDKVVVGEKVLVKATDEYDDPVAGATVTLDGEQVATTGDDGTATLTVDAGGDHEVAVVNDSLTSEAATVTGVVPGGAGTTTTTSTATATATTAPSTSTTDLPGVPGVPGFTVQLAIVGVALVAVLFGIRAWQRG